MVLRFWIFVPLLMLGIMLAEPLQALPNIPEVKISRSSKTQIESLAQGLKKIQKDLDTLKESLDKEAAKKRQENANSITATYLPQIMGYLSEKGVFLKEGFFSFSQLQKTFSFFKQTSAWEKTLKIITKALFSVILGFGFGYAVAFGLRVPIKTFMKWSKKEAISPTAHFLLSGLFILFPLIAFIVSQLMCFFLLEYDVVARQLIASLTVGGALLWIVWRLSSLLVTQPKPFPTLNKLNKANTHRFLSSLKGMALSYAAGAFLVDLVLVSGIPYSGQKIISDIAGLFFVIFLSLTLSAFQKPIRNALTQSRFLLAQTLAPFWWVFATVLLMVGYVFWVFDEIDLHEAFIPIILSLLIIPGCNRLIYWARKIRLSYLWKNRRALQHTSPQGILKTGFLVLKVATLLIYGLGLWVFFLIWEVQFLRTFRETVGTKFLQQGSDVLIIILAGYFLVYSGDQLLRYHLETKPKENARDGGDFAVARFKTILRVSRTLLRIVVWVPLVLTAFSMMNYDITPIGTVLGILTAGFAFSMQSFVKDFVTSFFMIAENTLVVGDMVEIDGKMGIVEDFGLRTLRVRMDNGILLTIPFGQINIVGNKSRVFSCVVCNISVAYGESVERIQQLVEKAFQTLKKTPAYTKILVAPLEVRGVNEVNDFSMVFQVKIRTAPSQQDFVRRGFNRILKQLFDEADIKVPTPSYAIVGKNPSLTNTTI